MTTSSGAGETTALSLRARILLLFGVALTALTLLTVLVTLNGSYQHTREQLADRHKAASLVLSERMQLRATRIGEGLRDLARNFSLKQLVAAGAEDPASLNSAMANYMIRLDASVFAVVSSDGTVLTSNLLNADQIGDPERFTGGGPAWLSLGEQHYLIKSSPLRFAERSPRIDAWLIMGETTTKLISPRLQELTGAHLSLVRMGETPQVWGSTLVESQAASLSSVMPSSSSDMITLMLADTEYVSGIFPLQGDDAMRVVVMVPEAEAYLQFQTLLLRLLVLLGVAIVLALVIAAWISHSITAPISELTRAARQISEGDEARDLPTSGSADITILSQAFMDMQSNIRDREAEVQRLAFFDPLTGLPNRNQFVDELAVRLKSIPEERSLSIALMDVDRFKEVNDTIGHSAGDRLLAMIAKRLGNLLNSDDFLARLGGDEFAIIRSHPPTSSPTLLGGEITAAFEQSFIVDGLIIDIRLSVGLTTSNTSATSSEALLQHADIALYSAKDSHDSYRLFEPSLDKYSLQRLNLMTQLQEALAQGQLVLHYQPKLSLDSNRVETAECLIRWFHPEYGQIFPNDFIPLAEQTGAIRDVTHWALATALKQQQKWLQQGIQIGMAVNISAIDLVDMRLPAYVGELQSRFDIETLDLTLEVTESAVMQDPDSALLALKNLRRMGIKLSIDDFGTGFSSMAQLKKMPVDELKIDKAFVQQLAINREDQVMTRTLITLASNLELTTVAEGVEDEDSLQQLREMGATKAQGYLISRPKSAREFEAWLVDYQRLSEYSA